MLKWFKALLELLEFVSGVELCTLLYCIVVKIIPEISEKNIMTENPIQPIELRCFIYLHKKQPSCKKRCSPCKKRQHEKCQGGGPEVAAMVE